MTREAGFSLVEVLVALAMIAGGLLALGGYSDPYQMLPAGPTAGELFDEASGRWFELPHSMGAGPREVVCAPIVSVPAEALAAPRAAAAGAQ